VNSSLNPFHINIGFLINHPIGYSRVLPFDIEQVEASEGIILDNVVGNVDLSRMQDGIRVQASFSGEIESECGRCLNLFTDQIHSDFEEVFLFPYMEVSEEELKIPDNGNINIEQLFNDFMIMGISIKPICKPDCKGLCDICGQDLNQAFCEHHREINSAEGTEKSGLKTSKT
jgi:uncharacterized protein